MTSSTGVISQVAHRQFGVHRIIQVQLTSPGVVLPSWLEPLPEPTSTPADLEIQVVERLSAGSLRFIEKNRLAVCEAGLVFCESDPEPRKVLLSMQDNHPVPRLICERGSSPASIIEMLIHALALSKGFLPLHAAAFTCEGKTAVASGFPAGGKTSLTLAFTTHGARFISDDWVYLDSRGQVYGIDQPVGIRAWQLDQIPQFRALLSPQKRRTHQWMRRLSRAAAAVPKIPGLSRLQSRAVRAFEDRAAVRLSPKQMFGSSGAESGGEVNRILLTLTHDQTDIVLETMTEDRALELMLQMQIREWNPLTSLYTTYTSVYGRPKHTLLSHLAERLETGLRTLMAGRQILCVYHPSPVSLDELFRVTAPIFSQ